MRGPKKKYGPFLGDAKKPISCLFMPGGFQLLRFGKVTQSKKYYFGVEVLLENYKSSPQP